jgi:hypothetical protein
MSAVISSASRANSAASDLAASRLAATSELGALVATDHKDGGCNTEAETRMLITKIECVLFETGIVRLLSLFSKVQIVQIIRSARFSGLHPDSRWH